MKKSTTLFIVGIFTATLFSQSPEKMSYQAVIRNSSNGLVSSSQVGVRISILPGSETGTPVYVETQTLSTNANGLVTIEIGGGTVVTGTFGGIDWSAGPYFIKTETAIAAPLTSYTITGTSQLLSVPYALYSKTSSKSSDSDDLKQRIKILEDILITAGTYKLADIDGNQYNVVKIGTQIWMAENLKTTKYNDNTAIPLVTGNTAWAALITPGYCWTNNDAATYKVTYGALYNWYTVNTGKLCPTGWHVPANAEWTILTSYLGGESIAGGKLKETGTTHWQTPNTGATNETGFTALPGGIRGFDGSFSYLGSSGYWWSATEINATTIYTRWIDYFAGIVYGASTIKYAGFSVRCLRD